MKSQDSTGLVAVVGIFMVTPMALALMLASSKLGAASIPIWMAVAGAAWLISRGAIGEAIAARLRGGAGQGELPEETLVELDDLRHPGAELEERQDFSERMLAAKNESIRPETGR